MRSSALWPALAAALAAGCASGPAFVGPEAPAVGRAAIYVYRSGSLFGAGVQPRVSVGTHRMHAMRNAGYLRANVAPVNMVVYSPDCSPMSTTLTLTPGATAYVQLELVNKTVELGGRYYFDYGCRIVERSEAEALPVLRGLRRSGD